METCSQFTFMPSSYAMSEISFFFKSGIEFRVFCLQDKTWATEPHCRPGNNFLVSNAEYHINMQDNTESMEGFIFPFCKQVGI